MNELLPMITERDGIPVTTSRAVAEQFGKTHAHLLRDIEKLKQDLEQTEEGKAFSQSNFGLSTGLDSRGKEQPLYLLTRDGFTLLAMGFTGAKAVQSGNAKMRCEIQKVIDFRCGNKYNKGVTESEVLKCHQEQDALKRITRLVFAIAYALTQKRKRDYRSIAKSTA